MSKFNVGDIVKHRHFEKWRAEIRGVGFSGPGNKPRVVARCTVEQHGTVPAKPYDLFFDEEALVLAPKIHKVTLITYKNQGTGTPHSYSSQQFPDVDSWNKKFPGYTLLDFRVIEIELKE